MDDNFPDDKRYDRSYCDRQHFRQRLVIQAEGNRRKDNGNDQKNHRHISDDPQHPAAARHPERPLGVPVDLSQFQKSRKHDDIRDQKHDEIQGEETPEQIGFRQQRADDDDSRSQQTVHDGRSCRHIVFAASLSEIFRKIPVIRSIGGYTVDTEGPGNHISEQRQQKQHRYDDEQDASRAS